MFEIFLTCFIAGIIQTSCLPNSHEHAHPSSHVGFGYNENDPLGPNHWPEKYAKCAGKYQSPIDIEENIVTRVALPPLMLNGFYAPLENPTITNNGHTVMVQVNSTDAVSISGGPLLNPSFKFAQFHFHWGANDSLGSEDMINNHSYPMELHMVFYNSDYSNTTDAQQYMDGLAVLAFFFEVTEKDNKFYKPIVQSLSRIVNPQSTVPLEESLKLVDLLPSNVDNYFTYMGSLTTPPCSEGVRWIDFKHPILLSHEQLAKFRTIHSDAGILSHNFRPIQPLSNRPIWYNSGSPTNLNLDSETQKSNSFKNQISRVFLVFSFVPFVLFYFNN
ncbi:carbonic anhydrase 2-like [Planococcus citri]|uniref:carbonic anhydrase 2-like n=1 Tax=Planococcus citri TaxID=170843 RepID=UPI0031F9BCDA